MELFAEQGGRDRLFPVQRAFEIVPGAAGTVTFVDSAAQVLQAFSTSVTLDLPTGRQNGDIAVMAVMGRNTPNTPAGWTEQASQDIVDGGTTQRLRWYTRILDGTEGTTVTVTQNAAQRLLGQIMVLRSSSGNFAVTVQEEDNGFQASGSTFETGPIPTQAEPGVLCLAFTSIQVSGVTTLEIESQYTQISPTAISSNRLCVAYLQVDADFADTRVDYTTTTNPNANRGMAWIYIRVSAA